MRHITRKRLLSFFLAMALILTFSPISAAATYTPEEHEVDEDIAVTIAMLFVWANIGESEWNRKTTVDNIIPMYNNSDEVCAYCINLKNGSTNAGYINVRNERGAFLGSCRKILSPCPLLTFLPSSGRSRERPKIKSLEKIFIPSLGRQRKRRKINPLEKIFCLGSKLEPFSCAGLLVAPKWSHFSSMASKVMPYPFRNSSVWQQN